MDRYPTDDAPVAPGEDARWPEPRIWEPDATGQLVPLAERTRRHAGRLGISVPSAIGASLLAATLALGAGGLGLTGATRGPGSDVAHVGDGPDVKPPAEAPEASSGSDEPGKELPAEDPEVDQPAPDEGAGEDAKPTPAEDPAPDDKPTEGDDTAPAVKELELAATARDGKIALDWSSCTTDGFRFYKVVRSTDDAVTYPKTEGDSLVATIEERTRTAAYDTAAPAGKRTWYRVFAFGTHDGATFLACRSELASATLPKPAEDEPTPKPTPDEVGTLGLELSIREGHPKVDWTTCRSAHFGYYKVLRSTDSTVRWPAGDNDTKVAAIENPEKTAILDERAPGGKKLWYRVFCLDAEGRVLAASAARAITTPEHEPAPKPEPTVLGFEVDVTADGVVLHWEACDGDGFRYYKVVRSKGPKPSYLPWTEGSEVIAVIEAKGTTSFVDTHVESGDTWFYRVQSIGTWEGHKVLLGQTPVREVSVP